MNYRHAFHAGNFADVFKHALLARVLTYLVQKPAPLRFIDTHAGAGRYDLAADEASRTGEWRGGIGAPGLWAAPGEAGALLQPYLAAVGGRDGSGRPVSYPGSPAIAQQILRAQDRMILCDLHPADAAALKTEMRRDKRIKCVELDGYVGLNAFVPPPERRGLVLIDPPFEDRAEFDRMLAALVKAHRKWAGGTYMLWFPIKDLAAAARWIEALRRTQIRRMTLFRLFVDAPVPDGPMVGNGLVVVNPPFTLKAEAETMLPLLAEALAPAGRGQWSAEALTGE